jgi:hypothetical protein
MNKSGGADKAERRGAPGVIRPSSAAVPEGIGGKQVNALK